MKELRIHVDGLKKLSAAVFVADGMSEENAQIVANSLICADLRGVSSHGMVRLKTYIERSHREQWNQNPHFTYKQNLPAVVIMDGDDGFGSLVGTSAMRRSMELANTYGVGVCGVFKSSHFGMASYYPLLAAQEDMIGFVCTNGMPNLAHFGSMEGMLGTNPFSIAIPVANREAMVLDIACSVTARGNIANAKREGRDIPEGWAMDDKGNPTTNAAEALKGCVLPFASHKGSGLAIVVDILSGVLTGAAYGKHLRDAQTGEHQGGPNVGHFFVAINIAAFDDPQAFKARVATALDELKAAKPASGFSEILMPGELEARKTAYNMKHGILMGPGAWREFCETCAAYGIKEDFNKYVLSENEKL